MWIARWWKSRKLRKVMSLIRHRYSADDDLMTEEQRIVTQELLAKGKQLLATGSKDEMLQFVKEVDETFYTVRTTHSRLFMQIREYLDIIAVVGAIAFGVRGLWLQPFKIPTGSMQPTLFGIHYVEREDNHLGIGSENPDVVNSWIYGGERAYAKSSKSGAYKPDLTTSNGAETSIYVNDENFILPGERYKVEGYANLSTTYMPPEQVIADGYMVTGDQLFVERISHLFFGLKRGDVVVFRTENITGENGRPLMENSGYYYIKRLVGLPDDTLKISDNMLYVKPKGESEFRPITEFSEDFDKIFSGKGGYHGYLNGGDLKMRYLFDENDEYVVPKDNYFMLGDNSAGSLDSRSWGTVPRENIVGKASFVFWPLSKRWGFADTKAPIDTPTGDYTRGGFPAMKKQ